MSRRARSGATPRRTRTTAALLGVLALTAACGGGEPAADQGNEGTGEATVAAAPSADARGLTELWNDGVMAFGVYVPDERPMEVARSEEGRRTPPVYTAEGAAELAANPLYDYLFLNLEGAYDPAAVVAVSAGVERAGVDTPPTLLVRIPPISADGAEAAGERVREILAAGADGVVMPHIRNVEEARTAVAFFDGYDVWSPENPDGAVIAMLMLEDPEAIAQLDEVVAIGGYSVLACGIGSLTAALDGDREAAEAMNLEILDAANEAGYADMITANAGNVAQRVEEGYLALLMAGPDADQVIRTGRELAGR